MFTSAKYECHVCEEKSQNITTHLSKYINKIAVLLSIHI